MIIEISSLAMAAREALLLSGKINEKETDGGS